MNTNTAPVARRPRPVLDEATWRRFERSLIVRERMRYLRERRINHFTQPQLLVRDDSVKGGWRPQIKVN